MATRARRLRLKEKAKKERHMTRTIQGVYRSGHKTMYIEREYLTANVIRALEYLDIRYRLKLIVRDYGTALSLIFEP